MTQAKNILITKLDEFIRKYYKNKLIRGSIYCGGILVGAFITVVTLEYFGEFNSLIRRMLFFGYLGAAAYVIIKYIAIPALKIRRIGQVISYDEAAVIVGNHFSNVQDKLLNVLQLQNNRILNGSDELLLAGINQKIDELRPVPFTTAVNLNENRKYLKYVLPLFLLTGLMVLVWPQLISKSAARIVNYETYYEKEMPFTFNIVNNKLQALQTNDFRLEVKITGKQTPDEVFIDINGISYRLEKKDRINFSYTFSNLQASTDFVLNAGGYQSRPYRIEVLPKPVLMNIRLHLDYPGYTGKEDENTDNSGDLQIPQGTKVSWIFNTSNTDGISLHFSDSTGIPRREAEDRFTFSRKFLKSDSYTVKATNHFASFAADSASFSVRVIPDQYPFIDTEDKPDSLNPRNIYFSGQIKDDYGFTSLVFRWKKFATDSNGKSFETSGSVPVNFSRASVSQPFFHFFDASTYQLGAGDRVEYYFEVFDNDAVNGAKSSRTRMMEFKAPTRDEINENTEKNNAEIREDIEESIKKARQLQKEINELSRKINDKKQPGYEEKKKLEELLRKQQELQNKINSIKQENELNNKQQNEFSKTDESILEKQQQLEKLFENVMSAEMKKLFDELNKLMEKLDKNMIQEKLEELKLSNKDIEKELDRNLEAFKQLEVAQKLQNAIDKLDELKKREDELREETTGKKQEDKEQKDDAEKDNKDQKGDKKDEKGEKKKTAEELAKKQEEISKEFEQLKKDLQEMQEKNNALEDPNKLPDTQKKQEEISQDLQKSSDQLGQNDKKSASESQKSVSEKMEQMRDELEQSMMEEEEQQESENAQALRQILENLLHLSFAQEELMHTLEKTRIDNPKFVEIPKQQNKLKEDSKIIEDSLFALSKRAPQISAIVNREISAINMNMERTVKQLADRNTDQGRMYMQGAMKSVNDLAALLNESLEEMQKQMKARMQNKSEKGGKCKKPGKGSGKNPSSQGNPVTNMRKMQEQLNKQLQELREALEKGQKPGGDKPGQKPGQKEGGSKPGMGLPGSSEQFAKMAAQQKALRLQIEQLMDQLKNKGNNPGGDMAHLMEETEKDLVNKRLNAETMRRQQEILTRLLESEKAERERELDEQRKSNEAKSEFHGNPEQFLEYKRQKQKEMELLNTVPPALTPYFKEKVNIYFNNLNK